MIAALLFEGIFDHQYMLRLHVKIFVAVWLKISRSSFTAAERKSTDLVVREHRDEDGGRYNCKKTQALHFVWLMLITHPCRCGRPLKSLPSLHRALTNTWILFWIKPKKLTRKQERSVLWVRYYSISQSCFSVFGLILFSSFQQVKFFWRVIA